MEKLTIQDIAFWLWQQANQPTVNEVSDPQEPTDADIEALVATGEIWLVD